MMYHVGAGRTVDVELAWSPDSIHWQRVAPGQAFLPLGAAGNYDSGCIYAQAGPPVVQDGELLIYYGGSPTVHLGWKRSGDLCLARLGEDRFAAYEPTEAGKPAVLTTSLLRTTSQPIRLNADGEVRMETLPEKDGQIRLRLTLAPGAKLYAITGATLVNTDLPAPKLEPLPRVAARSEPLVFTFDHDAENWKGVDALEHHAEGYISVSRSKNLSPILHGMPLEGDWPALLGSDEVTLSARIRAAKDGGKARMAIYARDVAQWECEKLPPLTAGWQTLSSTIRYDWTDEQALAAGWQPSAQGFSWRKTIRNAGKVAIMVAWPGQQGSFDVDEVRLQPR